MDEILIFIALILLMFAGFAFAVSVWAWVWMWTSKRRGDVITFKQALWRMRWAMIASIVGAIGVSIIDYYHLANLH